MAAKELARCAILLHIHARLNVSIHFMFEDALLQNQIRVCYKMCTIYPKNHKLTDNWRIYSFNFFKLWLHLDKPPVRIVSSSPAAYQNEKGPRPN